jgi:cob(I)alamin adenosyltransferase
MKIYTKTGDKGQTALFGGKRVPKDDLRVEAYGTLDELNSHIGLLREYLKEDQCREWLQNIQNQLFVIGSQLATDPDARNLKLPELKEENIRMLEQAIDKMEVRLEPLKSFILPAGSISVAQTHIARTVCRRAERRVVSLSDSAHCDPQIIIYLNRLSDFLFVLARFTSMLEGIPDVPWNPVWD